MPIIEDKVIVILLFASSPRVKCFIHHYKTHAIGKFKKFWSGRIMTRANRVHPHLFHDLELPLQRTPVDG